MPSRSALAWVLRKEWRALLASNAWWVMLILIGPLVGVSFIDATRTYADLSGYNGTAAGVGEAFSPLVGVWAPTFSACELAAVFLLPFVAIRVAGADRKTGAAKIELQGPLPSAVRIGAKALVLLAAWAIASAAPLLALLLWWLAGGSVHPPELLSVGTGHVLNAGLTIALASAAAVIAEHPSTAAITTLAVTVGTWILNFIAAVHGGAWARAAEYTPPAIVAGFQHGLIRLDVLVATITLILAGLSLAAIWSRSGVSVRRRAGESVAMACGTSVLLALALVTPGSWDVSENRMNSFSPADERFLNALEEPLRITAYLAPEDPRRSDLERHAVSKLRRTVPDVQVDYVSATGTGLFEQSAEHYGEIHYRLGAREHISRATTAEGVLESIYDLAGHAAVEDSEEEDEHDVFRGHPLAHRPRFAAAVFYGAWPMVAMLAALRSRRRGS